LNYDTGEIDPLALPADISVTFAYPKIGHARFPGAGLCGELIVADIGTDPQLAQALERELVDPALVRSLLPARPRDAHKGTFGQVLIVSGSTLYTGAPISRREAAYRSGAGLVTLAMPQSIHAIMASKINEATFLPLPDQAGALTASAFDQVRDAIMSYTATLIGPGLTIGARPFIERLLTQGVGHSALVLDADALNILAQIDQWWSRVPSSAILTPHPGEMARLTKLSAKEIEANRERIGSSMRALGARRRTERRVHGDRRAGRAIDPAAFCESGVSDGGQRRRIGWNNCCLACARLAGLRGGVVWRVSARRGR